MSATSNRIHTSSSKNRLAAGRAALAIVLAMSAAAAGGFSNVARAGDVTWDNGSSNFLWDTSSLNWSGAAWNNANGDGAIFGVTGVGALNLPGPIYVNSLNFTAGGYSLNGTGPLSIASGTSTQTTGVANVATGTATINVPLYSALGFQKIGAGTLELGAPSSFTGGIPLTSNGILRADLLVGGASGPIASGTLRLMNSSVVPSSTRVSIANGLLDIGSNNVTLSQLTFVNQTTSTPWDPINKVAASGVIGSGTLRVLGDINVIGVSGNNPSSNTIAANLDLGGGTQVVRVGLISSIGLSAAMQFTGTISNGSLLKTIGYTTAGVQGSTDGMGLFGNNTYTGATIINSGTNIATGTNASTSIKVAGIPAGPAGGSFSLQGANGSFQSATLIQAIAGGTFILDNNAALGASGNNQPNIPAAQNNDRIRDDAELQLRDGNFTYRGKSAIAATETFGNLNVVGGHNVLTITPNGTGGTATLTANGNLSLGSRATLQVSTSTLGAASKLFVNGTLPTADATGILPRIVGSSDFLTYNATTGLTPYTGYATDFSTPGTNVAVTAASTVASSVNINALKRTGTFTTTIAGGQTLGINSGMILNTSGTGTITGGTLAFGSTPGIVFGGTNTISSAITGSAGLINTNSTLTLSGDLSGLTGGISTYSTAATTTLSTNTYTGPLDVRAGTLNLNVSQTGSGLGAITLGVPQNDANLVGTVPTLSIAGAGANAVFNRDIIVDNGAQTAAGVDLGYSLVAKLAPLSNSTGSQTINGNITLNSPLNFQGGGGGGTGATNFTGAVSGPAKFIIPNGRVNFSGPISNTGGFLIGNTGMTAQVAFTGTASSAEPIVINVGNANKVSYNAGALPTGPITAQNAYGSGVPSLIPLQNSTLPNSIILNGDLIADVGAGITAEWSGPVSGPRDLYKWSAGKLILSNAASSHSGYVYVSAGTLEVDGAMQSAYVSVSGTGLLQGVGGFGGSVTVNSGGSIAPGNSVGTFLTGNLSILGNLNADIDLNSGGSALADLLAVSGSVSLSGAALNLSLLNPPTGWYSNGTYLLVANDGSLDPVSGTFSTITGLPAGYYATIDYAFNGVDSLGRLGNGNDIAVVLTPEPASLLLFVAIAAAQVRRRGRR